MDKQHQPHSSSSEDKISSKSGIKGNSPLAPPKSFKLDLNKMKSYAKKTR